MYFFLFEKVITSKLQIRKKTLEICNISDYFELVTNFYLDTWFGFKFKDSKKKSSFHSRAIKKNSWEQVCRHVYSEVNPLGLTGAYSQISAYLVAAFVHFVFGFRLSSNSVNARKVDLSSDMKGKDKNYRRNHFETSQFQCVGLACLHISCFPLNLSLSHTYTHSATHKTNFMTRYKFI